MMVVLCCDGGSDGFVICGAGDCLGPYQFPWHDEHAKHGSDEHPHSKRDLGGHQIRKIVCR